MYIMQQIKESMFQKKNNNVKTEKKSIFVKDFS